MPAAGARAGEAAADGGRIEYTLRRLGTRPSRRRPRALAIAAAAVLLASGGVALASLGRPGSHAARAVPAPTTAGPRATPAPGTPGTPATWSPSASMTVPSAAATMSPPAVVKPNPPAPPGRGRPAATMEVIGVGCPRDGDDAVTFDNAPAGPGWSRAAGGWTGNGCDGSTLWTQDPNGKQPVPSTLTWRFSPPGASRCTLAVFVPTRNAQGVSDYSVSVGPPPAARVVAAVPVRQSALAGQWLTLGTFPVSGSSLEITTAPLPGAAGPGHHGAVAASAARAACTS